MTIYRASSELAANFLVPLFLLQQHTHTNIIVEIRNKATTPDEAYPAILYAHNMLMASVVVAILSVVPCKD